MTNRPSFDVLAVGDLFQDLVMSGFRTWPRAGEESFAHEFHKEIGGGAAITACGLAKLGLRAGIIGVVGESDGQWMLDRLRVHGVSIDGIKTTAAEPTAIAVSISTTTDRTFLTYNGANRELPALIERLAFAAQPFRARHVHFAHALDLSFAPRLFEELANSGLTVSVDVGWHPEWYGDTRAVSALQLADVFFPNEREAEVMTHETEPRRMLDAFRRMGLKRVAMKRGQSGAALLWDGEILFQEPGNIEPVDTTGAGDCFDAGFLYARLTGMDPKACLKVGAVCGEMSARALGGIAGFPSKNELDGALCSVR
ncbi:MAG: carbohydrate kinase family protein [Acidobacteria bacterium]|nr:carbohydrate kinase family protein [Acidobacteriota bacterium]MBS1865772.1 carbohydrate kinase family protein [Acidobacteriota bacterium]